MSADNVTPIRPGSELDATYNVRNVIDEHLAQARAIIDLVYICHVEDALDKLDGDNLGWALTVVTKELGAAEEAVGKLDELARGRQEPQT